MTRRTGGAARDGTGEPPLVRREWTAPSLRHFIAGRAEAGTGTGGDGSFIS